MNEAATTYPERTWNFGRCDDAPDGPWENEPDKIQWVDEATGLDCLILRNRGGALCGYVGVPEGHPWFGVDYDSCRVTRRDPDDEWTDRPEVHGGLTFAALCAKPREDSDRDPDDHICHVPYPGRTDKVFWLGFDTAHSGDLCPLYRLYPFERDATYKDVEYVKAECANLARQAATDAQVRVQS